MGKKYIAELPDCYILNRLHENKFLQVPIVLENGDDAVIRTVIPITPYAAPDLEQVRKEAYDRGHENGYSIGYDEGREAGIQAGMCDAWDAARKIVDCAIPYEVLENYLEIGECTADVIKHLPASKAIEVIRQYEQEKEKIKVGDEVENTQTGVKFIVTHLWENNRGEQGVSGFNQECSAFSTTLSLVVKTGRHFPEIAEVMEKMRESE